MFDWVLNTPLFPDGYYLHSLSSLCVHILVPECFKNVVSFKFKIAFSFWTQSIFYEMVICCIIVTKSYNNAGL